MLTELSLSGYVQLQQNLQLHTAAWEGAASTITKHILQIKTGNVFLSYCCRTAAKINLKDSSNLNMKEAEYDSSGIIKLRKKSGTNPRSWRQQCILAIQNKPLCSLLEVLIFSSEDLHLDIFLFSYSMEKWTPLWTLFCLHDKHNTWKQRDWNWTTLGYWNTKIPKLLFNAQIQLVTPTQIQNLRVITSKQKTPTCKVGRPQLFPTLSLSKIFI